MRTVQMHHLSFKKTGQDKLLQVSNLSVCFPTPRGMLHAVRNVSFDLEQGEILAIVGESGCGKSVTGKALLGLVEPPGFVESGTVELHGEDILKKSPGEQRSLRGKKIGMIFQDPSSAFDPVYTIGNQITETLAAHNVARGVKAKKLALRWLERAGFTEAERVFNSYPFELSGGMRQRAYIAMVMALEPQIIVADEPTTALDMISQVRVLLLLKKLQKSSGCSIILITHDLNAAASVADEVMVMYAGQVVEYGAADDILCHPVHPYTAALVESSDWCRPRGMLKTLDGQPPNPGSIPSGCFFAPRCNRANLVCRNNPPQLRELGERLCRCHNVGLAGSVHTDHKKNCSGVQ